MSAGMRRTLLTARTPIIKGIIGGRSPSQEAYSIYTTYDGVTWDNRSPGVTWYATEGIHWSPALNMWFAAGGGGYTNYFVSCSPDGINWTYSNIGSGNGSPIRFTSDATKVYVATTSGYIYSSTNGTTWTGELNTGLPAISSFHYENGYFLLASELSSSTTNNKLMYGTSLASMSSLASYNSGTTHRVAMFRWLPYRSEYVIAHRNGNTQYAYYSRNSLTTGGWSSNGAQSINSGTWNNTKSHSVVNSNGFTLSVPNHNDIQYNLSTNGTVVNNVIVGSAGDVMPAIAHSPSLNLHFLAGSGSGDYFNIFKSSNSGANWSFVTSPTYASTFEAYCMAFRE